MRKKERNAHGALAPLAAALALVLGAVTAMPAAADEAPSGAEAGKANPSNASPSGGASTDEAPKAVNPCAVKKKKKKRGPCAVGG